MSSAVGSITFDCADPFKLAQFWSQVVQWPIGEQPGPEDIQVGLAPPEGHPMLLFIRVPEGNVTNQAPGHNLRNLLRRRTT